MNKQTQKEERAYCVSKFQWNNEMDGGDLTQNAIATAADTAAAAAAAAPCTKR